MSKQYLGFELHDISKIIRSLKYLFKRPTAKKGSEVLNGNLRVPTGNKFDFTRAPYMLHVADNMLGNKYKSIAFMAPARCSKTALLVHGLIYLYIVHDPSDVLLVHLTGEQARRFSKTELSRIIYATPEFKAILTGNRSDDSLTSKLFKNNSFLKIVSPSVENLASATYRVVVITDYDRHEDDVGGEGDLFALASKRTQTYGRLRKNIVESSPAKAVLDPTEELETIHDAPKCNGIASIYNQGTKFRYFWKCVKGCKEWFHAGYTCLYWDKTKPIDEQPETARVQCPNCHQLYTTQERNTILRDLKNQVWLGKGQTIDKDDKISGNVINSDIASYWLEGPAASETTLEELVQKWVSAELIYNNSLNDSKLKTFFNVDLGRPFVPKVFDIQADIDASIGKSSKNLDLVMGKVPQEVRYLIAAVDVQKYYFVVQVVGFDDHKRRYLIDRFSIRYSKRTSYISSNGEKLYDTVRPSESKYLEDWDLITSEVVCRRYPIADSDYEMGIFKVAIDMGGFGETSNNAKAYASKIAIWLSDRTRVNLVKGESNKRQNPYVKTKNKDAYLININIFKNELYEFKGKEREEAGAYIFPHNTPEEVFYELSAEQRLPDGTFHNLKRKRNEALDLFVYANAINYIMLEGSNFVLNRPWSRRWNEGNSYVFPKSEDSENSIPRSSQTRKSRSTRVWRG